MYKLLLLLSFIGPACFASAVPNPFSPDHIGYSEVKLTHIEARNLNGQTLPTFDKYCKQEFGSWVGKTLVANYHINPTNLHESALVTIDQHEYGVSPQGLTKEYGFIDAVPEVPGHLARIYYTVTKDFNQGHISLLFRANNPVGPGYECVISG